MLEIFKTVKTIFNEKYTGETEDFARGFERCFRYFEIGYKKTGQYNLAIKIHELEKEIEKERRDMDEQRKGTETEQRALAADRKALEVEQRVQEAEREALDAEWLRMARERKEIRNKVFDELEPNLTRLADIRNKYLQVIEAYSLADLNENELLLATKEKTRNKFYSIVFGEGTDKEKIDLIKSLVKDWYEKID